MSQNFCLHTNLKKSPLTTPCLQHPSEFRKSHLARLDFQSFLLNYIFIGNSQVLFCSSKLLLLASVNIMGPIWANFHFFPLSKFQYLPFLAIFEFFLPFSVDIGVLRVLVSYKVTRGILWVVGRVLKRFKRGLGAFSVPKCDKNQKTHFLHHLNYVIYLLMLPFWPIVCPHSLMQPLMECTSFTVISFHHYVLSLNLKCVPPQ